MKRIGLALLLVLLTSCASTLTNLGIETLYAQTFPQTVHAEIDVTSDVTVVSYIITWDNTAPVTYSNVPSPASACGLGTPCVKSPPFIVNDSNTHTLSIVAHSNLGGNSPALVATFQVKTPAKPTSTGSIVQPGT